MWLIVLEAAAALAVLVFIVWWTMFAGRRAGELPDEPAVQAGDDQAEGGGSSRGGNKKLKG